MDFLIVFIGAGLGGISRHGINVFATRQGWTAFPVGTMTINIVGSFLIGIVAEYFALRSHLPVQARLFLTTGILGGFTTFSAFSLETALLVERGKTGLAACYVAGSVVFSIGALFGAMALVRGLLKA
jgi:CrcB protein